MSGSTVKASVITATIDPTRKPPISAQPSRTSNSYSLLRLLIPAVPNLLFHTGAHILSLSQTTSYWDLKTTLTITFLRKFMSRPKSNVTVEQAQRRMNFPVPVALDTHRVNVAFATSKDVAQFKSIETAVRDTIVSFGEGKIVDSQIPHTTVERLTAEWIGYRKEFRADSIEAPDGAEAYASLIDDLGNDGQPSTTVLYFHGGGYSMCDPHTHRKSITKLACAANAQVFVCRYRLAPQSPFPAALIDALVSYLYLLQPPEGAFHDPIPSPKIVFAGDSAGGGLSLALLQLLFHLNRNKITLRWYGKDMCPPLPAGIGLISAWCDVSRAFSSLSGMANGSEDSCQPFDYLPAPAAVARFTYCDSSAWNRALRRERQQHQLYAADVLVDNPLVSPMLAKSWTNMGSTVPVWMSIGDECLRDSNIFLAQRLEEEGVKLRFEKYTGMPHVFQGILHHLDVSKMAWDSMGRFINHVTGSNADTGLGKGEWEWGEKRIHPKSLVIENADEETKTGLTLDLVQKMVQNAVDGFVKIAQKMDGNDGLLNSKPVMSKI